MEFETTQLLGATVRLAIGLFGVLAAVQFILLPSLVARFRQDVFAVRRRLFLFMADGRIAPDNPAYGQLRTAHNSMLRHAERISFLAFILTSLVSEKQIQEQAQVVERALNQIPDQEARVRLKQLRHESGKAILLHLVRTSPLVWVFALFALAYVTITTGMHSVRTYLRGLTDRLPARVTDGDDSALPYAA